MREERLELSQVSPLEPKSSASAIPPLSRIDREYGFCGAAQRGRDESEGFSRRATVQTAGEMALATAAGGA